MKLVERMPRVCKAVIKAKRVATLKNLKLFLDLFYNFVVFTIILQCRK
jgi:hypothetical protein